MFHHGSGLSYLTLHLDPISRRLLWKVTEQVAGGGQDEVDLCDGEVSAPVDFMA